MIILVYIRKKLNSMYIFLPQNISFKHMHSEERLGKFYVYIDLL